MGLFKNAFRSIFLDGLVASKEKETDPLQNDERPAGFALCVGLSTGTLADRGHTQGIASNQCVWLANNDAYMNIAVFGGIGAGKTTRAINPMLSQALSYSDVGGLIFDIKGDFKDAVYQFAAECGREVITIGVGEYARTVNLLKGLNPEQASSYMQNAFSLCGGNMSDGFWIQSATDLCRNVLGLLQALGEKYYTMDYLYRYVFLDADRDMLNNKIEELELDPISRERRLLDIYRTYYDNVFAKQDPKLRESIKMTLSSILSSMVQNPDINDAFSGDNDTDYDMTGIINGDMVLVDLPLAQYGNGAKLIYTFIKLRFFNLLQSRQADKKLPQNPTLFICDEYQTLASASTDGLSDLNFWDKSRSAKVCGIISSQSVSAFQAAIKNKTLSDTILANFRQKMFFRVEDAETLRHMNEIAGRVEVTRTSKSYSNGTSRDDAFFSFKSGQQSENYTVNTSIVERQVVDANLVRQLNEDKVLALFNIEGAAADDVLLVTPKYVN